MGVSLIQRAFGAGELHPALHSRADLAKYLTGLRTCRNFVVQRHGGVSNRSGFKFVAEVKSTGAIPALHPFIFTAADASYVIEAGHQYFRFHRHGAPVTVSSATAWSSATAYAVGDLASRSGRIYYCLVAHTNSQPPSANWYEFPIVNGQHVYEIPTPYQGGEFDDPARACFTQHGLRVTITHLSRQPRELALLTLEQPPKWVLSLVSTGPSIAAPTGLAGAAGAAGAREFRYVVTALQAETYEESHPSDVFVLTAAADPTVEAPHVLSWTAVTGAVEYRIYADPFSNGTFGFLGVATGQTEFRDVGQVPDFSLTPPIPRALFATSNNFPAVNTMYQQRRVFAGTHISRDLVYASQVGFRSNFGIRSPLQDDDAVTFQMESKLAQVITNLVSLELGLVILTDSGEWVIKGDETGTLLPTAINPRQHGYVGSAFVPPVIIGESVIFVQDRSTVLRDLRFDEKVEGLSGRDLTIYAGHLFNKSKRIVDMAYAQVPDSVVWCVRSDGALCGLTYIRDEDVWGWHRHDTGVGVDGGFRRVCVIPEGHEDFVYAVVQREVNGQTKTYVERMASREIAALADGFFVDSGITYSGGATTSISGLSHLRGRTVAALADGIVRTGLTVSSSGTVTLPAAASKVHIGLPITAQLETLDLDVHGSSLRDKRKIVKALGLLLLDSARGFYAGPDAAHLELQRAEPYETTGVLVTGRQEMRLTGTFNEYGRVLIQHTDPTPLTVLGLMPHIVEGG